jgi:hypothetical protein
MTFIVDFDPDGVHDTAPEMYPGRCPVCRRQLANQPGWCVRLVVPIPGGRHSKWVCTECKDKIVAQGPPTFVEDPFDPDDPEIQEWVVEA